MSTSDIVVATAIALLPWVRYATLILKAIAFITLTVLLLGPIFLLAAIIVLPLVLLERTIRDRRGPQESASRLTPF
jgi:hypothetical protein